MISELRKVNKIICVIPSKKFGLKIGDTFELIRYVNLNVDVKFLPITATYPKRLFITLEEYRNNKLNIILND